MSNTSPNPVAGRLRFRKLRIAWSVVWGIACVLLVALWVRSYWLAELVEMRISDTRALVVGSILGGVSISPYVPTVPGYFDFGPRYRYRSEPRYPSEKPRERQVRYFWESATKAKLKQIQFAIHPFVAIRLPYFVFVGLAGTFAALPWLRWRFSLRTLLIATTLVALVLGLIVWLSGR